MRVRISRSKMRPACMEQCSWLYSAEAIRAADRFWRLDRRVYELAAQVEPTLELLNPSDGSGEPASAPPVELRRTLRNLGGEIECLAVCSNTAGFHCSAAGGSRLVAKGASEAQRPLGPACLFVSYDLNERSHHLLVIELPSGQRHRLDAEIDWSLPISDLHCDSSAQRLYISQGEDGCTVVSLSGNVLHKINANSLEHKLGAASAVVSGRDQLFLLDGKEKRLLGIDKSDYSVSADFDLGNFFTGRPWMGGLAISGSRVLVADKGGRSVHKVCSLTGRLIASYPTAGAADSPQLQRPTGLAVDSRGVVCVSDSWGQTVQLFLADGSPVHVLGIDGQPGGGEGQFDGPQGVGLLESDPLSGQRLLYVADWRNQAVKDVALCEVAPSVGVCPHSGQPLCRGHLHREQRRVRALGLAALKALAEATENYPELRRCLSRQEADQIELEQQFRLLKAQQQYWRRRICDAAKRELDQLTGRIRALEGVVQFSETANRAADAGNWRHVFQLVDQISDSVVYLTECETPSREAESLRAAESLAGTRAAHKALTDGLLQLSAEPVKTLGPVTGGGRIWRVAICDNTASHWVCSSGSNTDEGLVTRSRSTPTGAGGSWRRLAPVCLVVAFHADDQPDHLALLAMKGGSSDTPIGRLTPPLRWSSPVHSLRCDSGHQLLYLTQGRAGLFILDLTGRLRRRLTPQALGLPPRSRLTGLSVPPGSQRFYALSYAEQKVAIVSRQPPWPVLASLDVSGCYSAAFFTESLAWCRHGRRLLITDWAGRAIRRLDVDTGRVVATLTGGDGDAVAFQSPYDVLTDQRGRLYIADVASRVIRLLDADGRRCLRVFEVGFDGDVGDGKIMEQRKSRAQTVGSDAGEAQIGNDSQAAGSPMCLDLWEGGASGRWDWLVVADSNGYQVRVHKTFVENTTLRGVRKCYATRHRVLRLHWLLY
uniref:NHL repeat containing protein n=1 Tax=Macrostomum lignano TaxID=282301 RepID=A0A1I8GCE6_9PLAT